MIPAIIAIIGQLFSLAGKLFDWMHEQHLVDLGKTREQLANLKAQVDAAHLAVQTREAVRAHIASHPEWLSDNDPFRRD